MGIIWFALSLGLVVIGRHLMYEVDLWFAVGVPVLAVGALSAGIAFAYDITVWIDWLVGK